MVLLRLFTTTVYTFISIGSSVEEEFAYEKFGQTERVIPICLKKRFLSSDPVQT